MKQFAVHGKVRGKKIFESDPVVHVWADSEDQAKERGRDMVASHDIWRKHYNPDEIQVKGPADE